MHDDVLPRAKETRPVAALAESPTREARIRRMVEAHVELLWRFMRRLGVAPRDLDDAMQEVIVVAALRLESIPGPAEKAFLFGTALRVASEWRRFRVRRREVGDGALAEQEDPVPDADALLDQARARTMLDEVLESMPMDLRAVFTLYELEELKMNEIAELLGVPAGTVASRLRRAREHFEAQVARLQARMKGERRGR
jgi:RNA polymerase sigma-70 factor (ECF subfamily)